MAKLGEQKTELVVSNRTILRVLSMILLFILFIGALKSLSHVLTLIFFSAFLAMALNPTVVWLSRRVVRTKSRVRATAITYVMVLTLLVSFFSVVIPPLIRQTTDFVSTLPATINNFRSQDSAVSRFVYRYNLDGQLDELGDEISTRSAKIGTTALLAAGRVGGVILSIITVLVLTFMMLVEGPSWVEKFWLAHPTSKRERRREVARRMYNVVTGYVNGQLLITTIAASCALVALLLGSTIFDAPINPVGLAGIVAIFGLIPMIGNTLAAIIVVLACLLVSTPLAIMMAIFFVVYQQIENVTLQPYIQSKKNELTPLLVFIAALVGASIGGILGAFVAIPVMGCLKIIVEDGYNNRIKAKY